MSVGVTGGGEAMPWHAYPVGPSLKRKQGYEPEPVSPPTKQPSGPGSSSVCGASARACAVKFGHSMPGFHSVPMFR